MTALLQSIERKISTTEETDENQESAITTRVHTEATP